MPYSSEYFEPVRKGYFAAQGFVGTYEKAKFDWGGQPVMCFREWAGLVGSCFLREREVFLSENG